MAQAVGKITPWPNQESGVTQTIAAIDDGEKSLCVTSPTGGGKTLIMQLVAEHYLNQGKQVILYTNRKMLVEQTSLRFKDLEHGIRAAGYEDRRELPLQISSIQTEHARVHRSGKWQLHDAAVVLIDEAHNQTGPVAQKLMAAHQQAGASCVGFTATPIGIGHLYNKLVIAGTNSELRKYGALVICHHYGPDEPDLKHIKRIQLGEDLSESQNRKAMMVPGIFGRVETWFRKLNPEQKPTILFAPGVAESIWFAEQFNKAGISAAHIDGEDVWINGRTFKTSREARQDVLDGSKSGEIAVVCNRFVLREGVDCPWLAHGIFATVFGSLQSAIQSGGRLLRAYPGIDFVTIQDHGGNWHRHGSLNSDRQWNLEYTASMITGMRQERLREKKEKEPFRCPQCSKILTGILCQCGFEIDVQRKARPVIQQDGTYREYNGDIYKPRRTTTNPDAAKIWERMYHRAKSAKWDATFRQAEAMFASENNWGWPPRDLPMMPVNELDWFRRVSEVPRERLRS